MRRPYFRYREKIEKLSRPSVWWSIWTGGAFYILYALFFNAAALLKLNYGLPGTIAMQDLTTGKLFLFITNIPLAFFTCLFIGHLMLALHKMDKIRKK